MKPAESGPSIDFGKAVGDADRGQMGIERRTRGIGSLGRDCLQWVQDGCWLAATFALKVERGIDMPEELIAISAD